MSERYFVVSESELRQLKRAAAVEALVDSLRWGAEDQELYDAEAACRARPVKTLGGITWWPADYAFDEDYR